jgi:hypothetical protein
MDPYLEWLARRMPLYEAGGLWWRNYHNALVPAGVKPEAVSLSGTEERRLLRESGAALIRYISRLFEEPTKFWFTCCSIYEIDRLSANVRSQVRRGRRRCEVRRVAAEWVAENGYECYSSAFARYKGGRPESREDFETRVGDDAGGPFEYWGVFTEGKLAGYAKCVLSENHVATAVLKFNPLFMKLYAPRALLDGMLQVYVTEQHKTVTNGFRSIAHDSNIQEFLERHGFCRAYCDLQVRYCPALGLSIGCLYPLRRLVDRLPGIGPTAALKGLLKQEHMRRSFQSHKA